MGPGDGAKYLTKSLWSGFGWAADFAAGGDGCAHRLFSVVATFSSSKKKLGSGVVKWLRDPLVWRWWRGVEGLKRGGLSLGGGAIGGASWPKEVFSLSLHSVRPVSGPGFAAASFRSPARQEREPGQRGQGFTNPPAHATGSNSLTSRIGITKFGIFASRRLCYYYFMSLGQSQFFGLNSGTLGTLPTEAK